MIGLLRGRIVEREHHLAGSGAEVIVDTSGDTGGLGYRVTVTPATAAAFEPGQSVVLHIHHHFWEADQRLFGFVTKDERLAFESLLAAHKVGPALALAIIATFDPGALAQVLNDDDIDALCTVPGVGKKTAQRLLVDLKSSLVLPVLDGGGAPAVAAAAGAGGGALADVREALASLGYGADEVAQATKSLTAEQIDAAGDDSGVLLKLALRALAGA
ncbi:MAG: Holliday junction branch migration protein RuvA [Acidimicrobiales bacterium]